jgi:hypothetical protein
MRRAYPARGNRGESKTHGLPRRFVRRLRWRPSRDPAAVAASMLRRDINSITSSPRYGCRVKAGSRFARELYSAGAPRHVGSPSSRCPWRNSRRPSFCFDLAAHRVSPEDALTSAGVGTPPCGDDAARQGQIKGSQAALADGSGRFNEVFGRSQAANLRATFLGISSLRSVVWQP